MPKGISHGLTDDVYKDISVSCQGLSPSIPKAGRQPKFTWVRDVVMHDGRVCHKDVLDHHKKIKIQKNSLIYSGGSHRSDWARNPRPPLGRKVDRPGKLRKPPPQALKVRILRLLRYKRYKTEPHIMPILQDWLIGQTYLSKWFYRDLSPYIRVWKDWITICKRPPFKLVLLVLRQLAYVPSTLDFQTIKRLDDL
jgi:hypothetical protein